MPYEKMLRSGIRVCSTRGEHAEPLEELQRLCFPTLDDRERFKASHYLKHIELFPEGQFVALDGGKVVGMTSTIRLDFDFEHTGHRFADIIEGGWLTAHEPGGSWLYGADIGTHPDYRLRGIARGLYAARHDTVRRLSLEGQVTVGMLRGYGALRSEMSAQAYYDSLLRGERSDPTISAQLHIGFEPRGLLPDYLNDPVCDNYGVLLVLPAGKEVTASTEQRGAMSYISLKTDIPGPKARQWLERRARAVSAGIGRATDVVVDRASGALVHDVDGNTFIDFAGGIGMLAVGHCPSNVIEAMKQQAEKLIHMCALVGTYEPYVRLAELLNEVAPGDFPKKTVLANSGAEAVENAVKLSRVATGRQAVVVFEGAYHGRTLLTLSLTSKYNLFKKGFGPFAPEIYRFPAPNLYRRPSSLTEDQYLEECLRGLDRCFVAQVDPSAVAAVLIEPVQGEAGFLPVPRAFLKRLRDLCDRHGMLLIADEVQCGMGRTGKLFAIEHYEIVPDLVTTAKSLGAGMPISAVTGRADVLDAAHLGGVGGTYGGSPLACVAAIEAIETIRKPEFLARATEVGALLQRRLAGWRERFPLVGDARGLGPMQLVELVRDRSTKDPAPEEALAIIKRAVSKGLVLIRAGLYSNCIRLMPPLTAENDLYEEGLDVLEEAIAAQASMMEKPTDAMAKG